MYVRAYARTRISRISKLIYIIVSLLLSSVLGLGVWGVVVFGFLCGAARRRCGGAAEMQIVFTSVCSELAFNLFG